MNPATKQLAFVLYPGLTPLDLIGPLQVLIGVPRADPSFEVVIVAETIKAVDTDSVIRLGASHTFNEVPAPYAIVVPGGGEATVRASGHPPLLDYVRQVDRAAEVVMSVCTGALILASAGLLAGRPATTHWAYVDVLELLGARPVQSRWVEDGKYLTTAGVSAGIDGGLHLARRLVGDDVARLIQLGLQYEPEPPLGSINWEPAFIDSVRSIWRPPLDELVDKYPHLARHR